MKVEDVLGLEQYALAQADKEAMLTARLRELTRLHAERCEPYGRILAGLRVEPEAIASLEDVPMLPIGLFKSHALRSVPEEAVFKVVTSSGTSGSAVSRVYLDAAAAQLQTRTLASIMKHWLGASRLPMIVVESKSILRNRQTMPARAAGIVGMSTFGRDHFFALDDELRLDDDGLAAWLAKHDGSPILVFGYTHTVWEHFLGQLDAGQADLRDGVLIHAGGWKKLAERAVTNDVYKAELARVTGLRRVHNFYGMAEQIGTAFVECEHGLLHAPNAADIIVRNPATWRVAPHGEAGVAQVLSALPESYPGHSILTEDLARVDAVDDCPCGRSGKAVTIVGRVPQTELRGCSDVYAHNHALKAVA